jgi:hypothetical protein
VITRARLTRQNYEESYVKRNVIHNPGTAVLNRLWKMQLHQRAIQSYGAFISCPSVPRVLIA